MLQWYRDLIALRRNEFQLTDGHLDSVEVDVDEDAQWLVMRRGTLHTVVNLAASSRWHVPLRGVADTAPGSEGSEGRAVEVVLAWDPERTKVQRDGLHLPPQSVAVVRVAPAASGT
jgi:maltooligosyltrehalose trehalohydrolase